MKDLYAVLGVSMQATPEDITKAFRKLSLKHHPDKEDKTISQETAKQNYQEIVEAYEELSNPLKKEKYDHVFKLKQMDQNMARQPVAGLLTHPRAPLSIIFKNLHAKMCLQARMQPLGLSLLKKSDNPFIPFIREGESVDFFHQLRDQASMPQDPLIGLISFKKTPLTPAYAFILFANFLKGEYVGFNHVSLRKYFETAIKETKKSADTEHILNLYQGIVELLKVVESDQNRKLIYSSMKKIIDYARYQDPSEDHIPVQSMAELFQLPAFRQLFSVGMQQQWAAPMNIPIERFFSSELDKVLEEDNHGQKSLYLYRLYAAQNDLEKQSAKPEESEKSESEKLRSLAYYCLDYLHVIQANKLVAMNQILQACVFLKKASQLEKDASVQFADEELIMQLTCLASDFGKENTPLSDFYAHHHSLRLLSNLKFEHNELKEISDTFKSRMFKLIDFFPCTEELQSNLDLVHHNSTQIIYLRNYLHALIGWYQENIEKTPENQKTLTLKRVDILYQAYEASLKNWYSEEFHPEVEQALRIELMEAFLKEQGASFWDISKNMDSNFNMVDRDEQGWLKPNLSLPFLPNLATYQSMEGVQFDLNTGEIRLALKKWTEQDPSYKQSFSHYDVIQIMHVMGAKDGKHVFNFSLDPIDTEHRHHPFQQMVYSPQSLQKTEFLFTLFLTDYLLKMFTTGYEVQGRYPYEVRTINSLISHLPLHLKKIITDFQKTQEGGTVHRFWIEASVLPTLKQATDTSITLSFGDIRMALKKHKMVYDKEGRLIDAADGAEGWKIYAVSDRQAFEKQIKIKDFNFRALVFIKNTDDVYIVEENKMSTFPLAIALTPNLKAEFLVQNFDATGLMVKPAIQALQDNDHFIYQLVNYVCLQAKKPACFSAERIFAEEFTSHYDEFCQYFPEFERLKKLSGITGAVKEMDRIFMTNNQQIEENQTKLQDTAFWKNKEQEVCQNIEKKQLEQFVKIYNDIQTDYTTHLASLSTDLQKMRSDMGSFTYHSGSPEITKFGQSCYDDIQKDFIAKHGQTAWSKISSTVWPEVITPQIPSWVTELNTQGAKKRASYRQDVVNIFSKTSAFLGLAEFNKRVDAFMDSQTQSLAQGVAEASKQASIKNIESQLKSAFPYATQTDITKALNGSCQGLAQVVAKQLASEAVAEAKTDLKGSIAKSLKLQANFKCLGFGLESRPCEKRLPWVPASYHHEVEENSSSLVYGGIKVAPSMFCELEANRHSLNLSRPSISAFSSTYDISSAKSFVSELQRSVSQASYKVDTSSVNRLIQDMENKISMAERERREAASESVKPTYGFYTIGIKDTPIIEGALMHGKTGRAGYEIFRSDSIPCAVLKSEINNLYSLDPEVHVPLMIRQAASVESLAKSIETHCKPPTPEDLKQSASSRPYEEKWVYERTPEDLLNQYEKLRREKKEERKAQLSVPPVFRDKPPMWLPPNLSRRR